VRNNSGATFDLAAPTLSVGAVKRRVAQIEFDQRLQRHVDAMACLPEKADPSIILSRIRLMVSPLAGKLSGCGIREATWSLFHPG